jgi:adenine-specific DNA methylase
VIERAFDVPFATRLAAREKQIQQSHRPLIGIHKWFARRPGSLFRALLLAEFAGSPLAEAYARGHALAGRVVADPFMGGGTTLVEANRLGLSALGCDVNPMAWWVVRQSLAPLDRARLREAAERVAAEVEAEVGDLYRTHCRRCGEPARVKYFLWVRQETCEDCGEGVDLFPGYLVAKNDRHTHFVLHCPGCRGLVERASLPARGARVACPGCGERFAWDRGCAGRGRFQCRCGAAGRYPSPARAPRQRLFGLELHCARCRPAGRAARGRLFAAAEEGDLARSELACKRLAARPDLALPDDAILAGQETRRLRRWGYRRFRDLFHERQLLGLGLLLGRVRAEPDAELRGALATIFSDCLRYQNLLCRYDPYALKCQDVFSVHGFPVGLLPCENNLLGIPGVGSGGFRHFAQKYERAKAWCEAPCERLPAGTAGARARRVATPGESVAAAFAAQPAELAGARRALLHRGSIEDLALAEGSLDGVFTDPPYFDNVQYAELMDFCFAWLRLLLPGDFPELARASTRSRRELTGNASSGRGLLEFGEGLSRVFCAAARALRPGGPFVFTWHHNDLDAYAPLVLALLDAGLSCTAALPAPGEMAASLHIHGTRSSVVDTVFVCRKQAAPGAPARLGRETLRRRLARDRDALAAGGLRARPGDLRCLAFGHLARAALARLAPGWRARAPAAQKLAQAQALLAELAARSHAPQLAAELA